MNKKDIRTNIVFTAVCAVFCTMLWGSAFPAIKTGYELFRIPAQDIPSKLIFAGARFSAAGVMILLTGLCFMRSRRKKTSDKEKGYNSGNSSELFPDLSAVSALIYRSDFRFRNKIIYPDICFHLCLGDTFSSCFQERQTQCGKDRRLCSRCGRAYLYEYCRRLF